MPNIRGTAFSGAAIAVSAYRERALTLLPPELHHYLDDEEFTVSGWYPEAHYVQMLRAAAELYSAGGTREVALRAFGGMVARNQRQNSHSALMVDATVERCSALWSSQHDTGRMTGRREGPRRVRYEVSDFPSASREFCLSLEGYMQAAMELAGAEQVSVQSRSCIANGDPSCVWIVTWEK